jgi:hypothetical protein
MNQFFHSDLEPGGSKLFETENRPGSENFRFLGTGIGTETVE